MSELKVTWEKIDLKKPVVKYIDLGNGTCFTLVSFYFNTGFFRRHFIGIERKGAFLFPTFGYVSGEYVSEKLNLPVPDANIIADWMNVQRDKFVKQQGTYSKRNIAVAYEEWTNDSDVLLPIILPETELSKETK